MFSKGKKQNPSIKIFSPITQKEGPDSDASGLNMMSPIQEPERFEGGSRESISDHETR